MGKGLVIVESPTKAKTIEKYLGKGFTVEASYGHVKDLPKSTLGVDTDNDFETEYIVIPGKEKVLAKLKKLALSADTIYLAPDPDREGEAMAAHLADELGNGAKGKKKKKKDGEGERIRRVTFNEITKRAVQEAFEHPRDIDQNLVDAQQARRVLDRLVGYQVSPLLWDKVRRGLSAGRVQTVALRLIVEREREIKAFQKQEYWTIDAHLAAAKPPAFDARFLGKGEEKIEVTNAEDAEKIRAALEPAEWVVRTVERKERRRNATPPFTTSKLQQDSSRKLRFSVKRTMMIAQRLYEGVELGEEGLVGLITYMRTDSTRVSNDALAEVRVLAASDVLVTNDSGAMHLAAALGRPVVAIFGPTDERATGPLGPHALLTASTFCRPCMLRDCPIDHRCMKRITVEAAANATAAWLDRARPS